MTKVQIIKSFIHLTEKYKRYPTFVELKNECRITRAMVRTHFDNMEGLKASSHNTGEIESILDVAYMTEDVINKTIKSLSKYKRFVITTAVSNAKVNTKFLRSIHTYCKEENAALIVCPVTNKGSGDKWTLSPELKDEHIVSFDLKFNDNIAFLAIAGNAKASDPITGLPRLARTNGSIICASPKQSLKYVATGLNKLPHALMSTGAITHPEYDHSSVMRSRQEYLAQQDHVMGAIILELDKDNTYHFRQIQADKDGGFADINSYYDSTKTSYMPEAALLGDLHVGETSPEVMEATTKLLNKVKVNKLFLGDVFSGLSCSHHDREQRILLAQRAESGELSLDHELLKVSQELKRLSTLANSVYVVRSNHDDFLDKYLQTGEYVNHPYNHRTALILALDKLDNKNPLEEHCRRNGVSAKVKFLERDASFKVAGIEMANHGDKGQNGARGSLKGLEESYGAIMVGHSHTAGIRGQAFQVGTSTHLILSYNMGASSWTWTHGFVFKNGNRQLLNVINGKFTTREL